MKQYKTLAIACLLSLGLVGCGGGDPVEDAPSVSAKAASTEVPNGRPVPPPPPETPVAEVISTFTSGTDGWTNDGIVRLDAGNGNPLPSFRYNHYSISANFRTQNPKWIGVLRSGNRLSLSFDLHAYDVIYAGRQVERDLVVEFRDHSAANDYYPYASVSTVIGKIKRDGNPRRWTQYAVNIENSKATELPPGWVGFGAENSMGEPVLPAGKTFADIIANADEIVITTQRPGFVSAFLQWDFALDNVTLKAYQ